MAPSDFHRNARSFPGQKSFLDTLDREYTKACHNLNNEFHPGEFPAGMWDN
jgi:hypothetical protein